MKKITIIALVFVLITFTSCSLQGFKQETGETAPPRASESGQPTAPAPPSVQIYLDGSIDPENATIDPVYEDGKINSILALCFEGLFRFAEDASGNAVTALCLADSYTSESDKVYSFTLKPGVLFSDGTGVTSEDWIWSFERIKNTAESPWHAYADLIESVSSPSEDKLVITLKEPKADFESILALPCFAVQSKKHFDEFGEEKYVTGPMGTGAYFIERWKIRDRYLLNKNKFYDGETASNVHNVTFQVINDPELRFEYFEKHGNSVCIFSPQEEPAALDPQLYKSGIFPLAEQRYICFNVTKAPFDNPQVRRALRMATDKSEIIAKSLYGAGKRVHNVFMDSSLYYNGGVADEGFDVDRAEALLAEAGYPDGFACEISFSFENEAARRLAQAISGQWAKIGVNLELNALDPADFNSKLSDLTYDVTTARWADETNDPAALAGFIAFYDISKGFHTGYGNPDLQRLVAEAGTASAADRESSYHRIQQILYDDCPLFPAYKEATSVAMHNRVEGFMISKLGHFNFNNLSYN